MHRKSTTKSDKAKSQFVSALCFSSARKSMHWFGYVPVGSSLSIWRTITASCGSICEASSATVRFENENTAVLLIFDR